MVISYLGRMDATLSWVPGLLNFAALVLFIAFLRAQSLPLLRFDGILLSAKPGVHPQDDALRRGPGGRRTVHPAKLRRVPVTTPP
ncbi:MAG: hypothetical protein ACLR8Y_14230 [Alistipes indistinctus]